MKMMINILAAICCLVSFSGCKESEDDTQSCFYNTVELSTEVYGQISNDQLIGKWQLEAFVNLDGCVVDNDSKPENFNVYLVFENGTIVSGTTSNKFQGDFLLSGKKIDFNISSLTEINEPDWGKQFLKASQESDYVFISDSKLLIFFNDSNEVMLFVKFEG